MKKITFLMLFALVSVMASAQGANISSKLVGKWKADVSSIMNESELKNGTMILNFSSNGQDNLSINFVGEGYEEGMKLEMGMNIAMPGTWRASGTTVTLSQNKSKTTTKITKLLVNGEDYSQMAGMMEGMLKEQMMASLGSGFEDMKLTNIRFSSDGRSFTCQTDGNGSVTFRKVQ